MTNLRSATKQEYAQTPKSSAFVPSPISHVEDTGLSPLWIQDLILKSLYYHGYLSGFQIAEDIALPFTGVTDQLLESLKLDKLAEVKTAQKRGVGDGAYIWGITGAGITRAREALERSQYTGPAPVPLDRYNDSIRQQSKTRTAIIDKDLRQVLASLVIGENTLKRIGPAVNSGTSIFLYGPPGNGKTSITHAVGNLILREDLFIPYSIYLDGQVVKLYDSVNHELIRDEDTTSYGTGTLRASINRDIRWVRVKRPFIVVGGELTMEGLDLVFDDINKYYEAPFQVKANGGLLLIDDFGRQQVRPRDLLNRWIVPLENRVEYLTLHTGRKVEVPFDVMVVFATNLPPRDLVDEAFLRRLRHKIEIIDPNYDEYREIFRRVAASKGVIYNEDGLAYLLKEWYIKRNRKLRASHPRDLCDQILDFASYLNLKPTMTHQLIDHAAESYFVEL